MIPEGGGWQSGSGLKTDEKHKQTGGRSSGTLTPLQNESCQSSRSEPLFGWGPACSNQGCCFSHTVLWETWHGPTCCLYFTSSRLDYSCLSSQIVPMQRSAWHSPESTCHLFTATAKGSSRPFSVLRRAKHIFHRIS